MLKKYIAIVTGGTRGLGAAIVHQLASNDWNVHFTYQSDEQSANDLLDKYENVFAYKADVKDYKRTREVVEEVISIEGKIDCLINNAGIKRDKSLGFMNERNWRDVIETNLSGVFNYSKFVGKQMIKQKTGVIINISSISAFIGLKGQTNYSASKAGVNGFTKALAKELGPNNIRVNSVCPGFIKTEMTEQLNETEMIQDITLGRFGSTKEIADVVVFLISNKASYITGQTIIVDGGLAI
ncbi:3-oxoacyl-ACP reductase FabG [Aquibacillus sp. 3ASR75-11]|uniref:3-oxoacyl-ACP reductase FabG n=1 Tax=Terrihalobacillus insolitus TaxID=2950438 RepID=A0A9X3WXJ1_9BACI|nr:3-oxoacyl-ACP reductase FabG [Terrihalobacillus insolitus]MDC3425119.1 3-oxoacyl-ACP reductase FabG [Terrihalobacillus insolitus]